MSKIVIISDFVYPNYIGGSAKAVYDTIAGFHENKIDYLLITRKGKGMYSINEKDDFFEMEKLKGKIIEIKSPLDVIRTFKYIEKEDILYIHHPILGAFYSLLPNKKIFFFHGPLHEEYKLKPNSNKAGYVIRYLMQKFVINKSEKIFVYSEYMKNILEELGIRKKVEIIPPLFDYSKFSKYLALEKSTLRKELNLPLNKKILITSRRLTDRTGVIELIKAFKDINLHYPENNYHLIIIGKGELENRIKSMCSNISNIDFIGYVNENLLLKYLRASDVYILPSKNLEGFGIVLLEAFSLNIPVVVSNKAGGAVEFVSKIDPMLVFDFDNMPFSLLYAIDYADNLNLDLSSIAKMYDRRAISKLIFERLTQ